MAVCRLIIMSYIDGEDYDDVDALDLQETIAFAEYNLSLGIQVGHDGADWLGFIAWGKERKEHHETERLEGRLRQVPATGD